MAKGPLEIIGTCAICGDPATHYDHNHVTGMVRGTLCARCNLALGHLRDRPELARLAALYLEKGDTDVYYRDVSRAGKWSKTHPDERRRVARDWARKHRAEHREAVNAYVRNWRKAR
jgi:hypothetical protein